jgi:NTE family protein
MFGLMYLLGYTSEDITNEVINKKLDRLKSIKFANLISKFGIDSGNNILLWIETLITKKGYNKDLTLKEFYDLVYLNTGKYINFDIIASNLNKYEYTIFNHTNTPNVKITEAIRMSISIPFIFTVTKYDIKNDKVGESGDIHVDGGLIENYPIHLFKENLENVVGLKLLSSRESSQNKDEDINSIERYIYHVMTCFFSQRDKKISMADLYKPHTIYIDIKNITSSMNLGLSSIDKKKLIELGYNAADKYFNSNCML